MVSYRYGGTEFVAQGNTGNRMLVDAEETRCVETARRSSILKRVD